MIYPVLFPNDNQTTSNTIPTHKDTNDDEPILVVAIFFIVATLSLTATYYYRRRNKMLPTAAAFNAMNDFYVSASIGE